MGRKGRIAILVAGVISFGCCSFAQVGDVAVLGVGNFTQQSVGEVISGSGAGIREEQSSRAAVGMSVEYSQWWGFNAASFAYTISPTDSKLIDPHGERIQWGITRTEPDFSWVRRLRTGRVEPFIKAGFGTIALNGGTASGWDRQFPLIAGVGTDIRVSSQLALRYGLNVDFLRASNFSDPTYRGARIFILQPRFGVVWRFGSRQGRLAAKDSVEIPNLDKP